MVVAGSGAAGLVAALAAATRGADVLVLERSDQLGGTTALGGGRVWIPANHRLSSNHGRSSADSVEDGRAYLEGLFPAEYAHMTEAFLAAGPAMTRFVEANTRHRFVACPTYPDYHPDLPGATTGGRCLDMLPADLSALDPLARQVRVPPGYLPMTHAEWERWRYPSRFDTELLEARMKAGIRTNGVALVAALVDGVIRAGARIETGARLVEVLTGKGDEGGNEGGKGTVVTRAVIKRADREEPERIAARAVVLACGGFDWDEHLRRVWHPAAQRATGAAPGNTGDALRIAASLGARTDNLGEGWWMPMMAVPGEEVDGVPYPRSLIRERAVPRQIMVNAAGRRFVDEAAPYNEVGKAMHGRDPGGCPNDPAYLVFDAEFTRKYSLPGFNNAKDAADARVPAWMPRAGSLPALAAHIGVDPGGLTATVARWNEYCAAGADRDFGRGGNVYDRYGGDPDAATAVSTAPNLGPLTEPPFYAARVLAGTIGTKGGPVTDATGTVLTMAGRPIEGLYAAGNAAAFWTADAYPAPGATLGIAMTMGYIAGRHAATL